jgi:hypothetical protein
MLAAMRWLVHSLLGALWTAALSTFGDFVWARFIHAHRPVFGLLHGLALCAGIGLVLGVLRGRAARGLLTGALIGLGAAGGYYVLAPFVGYSAMFVLWMALWIGFGWLEGVTDDGPPRRPGALVRGIVAALGSGAAFYAVSGIWTRPEPGGPRYAFHFLCWSIAFLPGFLALLAGHRRREPAA